MKTWNAAELVELNISETANGKFDFIFEFSHNGCGWNNDLICGNDNHGPEDLNKGNDSSTPDNLS